MIHFLSSKQRLTALSFLLLMYVDVAASYISNSSNNRPYLQRFDATHNVEDKKILPRLNAQNAIDANSTFINANKKPKFILNKSIPTILNDIGGPGQPEMQSFQSVNGGNLVDLFSGDFSYNIPLLDVGGYPINLGYSGGITMDQEASWVGLGWNINPGTISRNMRGIPDDFDGSSDVITKTQSIKENTTIGVGVAADLELFGLKKPKLRANAGVFFGTYSGFGIETGVGIEASFKNNKGKLSLNIKNSSKDGIGISPSLSYTVEKNTADDKGSGSSFGLSTNYNSRYGLSSLTLSASNDYLQRKTQGVIGSTLTVPISFAKPAFTPTISMVTTSSNFAFNARGGAEIFGVNGSGNINGYVNRQYIAESDKEVKVPAYGYLYLSNAQNKPRALLDFNREKDISFNYGSTPIVGSPQYTYDVYSISGEGIGGNIRPYRGDVGYTYDHAMTTKSNSDDISADLGGGNLFKGGFEYTNVTNEIKQSAWLDKNDAARKLIHLPGNGSISPAFEPVYFRNPGESSTVPTSYYNKIGGDNLVRIALTGKRAGIRATNALDIINEAQVKTGSITLNEVVKKDERVKRTQVTTFLTATDAKARGLEKTIRNYKTTDADYKLCPNYDNIDRVDGIVRKAHHISEMQVLNAEGKRYVYGIPAYNIRQKEVSFSVQPSSTDLNQVDKGFVQYNANDNTKNNNSGKDGYYSAEEIPAFAHSFLLTGILSTDYVDVKQDGITDDDLGDAIKFNYNRYYGVDNPFKWRTPNNTQAMMANYNEGQKTYKRDDKANYIYGEKEVWYLQSLESKTMIAVFRSVADRDDALSVLNENGGYDASKKLKRLERIDLYSKSDYVKNGANAKPIKSVHFEYFSSTQGLCVDPSNGNKGKLTLKKVYFTYNKNEKSSNKNNAYVFTYDAQRNHNYHPKKYDRWGNYKNEADNPGGLSNNDYPYTVQDKAKADAQAAAWNLTEIKLPSGGNMKISYESDDYAYVQDKRACQMFTIQGFGKTLNEATNKLYTNASPSGSNRYIIVRSNVPIQSKKEVFEKFIKNIGSNYLYLKMAVLMPDGDNFGTATKYEYVPVYGEVDDYGIAGTGTNDFYIKLKDVDDESAMVRAALQYLRLNLPHKAYPGSETEQQLNFRDAVRVLGSQITNIHQMVSGFTRSSKQKSWCATFIPEKSMIRLASPTYTKLGGGYRVKRVEVYDNWNKMSGERQSIYGQEYTYTTTEEMEVNGVVKEVEISSGVATYEPNIGGEENPFRSPIAYNEKSQPLAPNNQLYVENPLLESYFPGASVGYSKVRVRTINKKVQSANGWQESTFYTAKDFPTIVSHSVLDDDSRKMHKPIINKFLGFKTVQNVFVTQGFKIVLNDMHGKPKGNFTYAENSPTKPISYSINYYRTAKNSQGITVLDNKVWTIEKADGIINKEGVVGKDVELVVDLRQQTSSSYTTGIAPNVDGFVLPFFIPIFIPVPTLFKIPQSDFSSYQGAATVKIINTYGIIDSVLAFDKGSVISTKNVAYDAVTGEVLLTRTHNEFKQPIYNFSYPGHWAYSGMGPAYKNIGIVETKPVFARKGILYNNQIGESLYNTKLYFESGDELLIEGLEGNLQNMQNTTCSNDVSVNPNANKALANKAWFVRGKGNGTEVDANTEDLLLVDEAGNTITGRINKMTVIRSGKRNILNGAVGSIMSMGDPIRKVNGIDKIVIDDATNVVNASVNTYKDVWGVEQAYYEKDTTVNITKKKDTTLRLNMVRILKRKLTRGRGGDTQDLNDIGNTEDVRVLATSFDYVKSKNGVNGCKSMDIYTKSYFNFNTSDLPANAVINSAKLFLSPRYPCELVDQYTNGCGYSSRDWTCQYENNPNYTAPDFYGGNSMATIKRVRFPVSSSTTYSNLGTTNQNAILVSGTSYENIECTNLVRDYLSNGKLGFEFDIVDKEGAKTSNKLNYLGFINPRYAKKNDALKLSISYPLDTTYKVCRPYIQGDVINPYRWGMAGNWRVDRAYTYYANRRESDANAAVAGKTNIKAEGILENFAPYWQLNEDGLKIPPPDATKWVWNTAINQYNRKGMEIENTDALGRHTSGLYGYNQTIPVAVAQNARYRELLFDGFEDYSYNNTTCKACPSPKEIDFANEPGIIPAKAQANVSIATNEAHTGRYSIKINANASNNNVNNAVFKTSVVTTANADIITNLQNPINRGSSRKVVIGKGTGLTATYTGISNVSNTGCEVRYTTRTGRSGVGCRLDPTSTPPVPTSFTRNNEAVDFVDGVNFPHPNICNNITPVFQQLQGTASCTSALIEQTVRNLYNKFSVRWQGVLQAKDCGQATLTLDKNANNVTSITLTNRATGIPVTRFGNIYTLEAGVLYNITVDYEKTNATTDNNYARLLWSFNGEVATVIGKEFLYNPNITTADTVGSLQTITKDVIGDKVTHSNGINNTFSLIQNKKMVLGFWMKPGAEDCVDAYYPNVMNSPSIIFSAGGNDITNTAGIYNAKKLGNRIEGWQRYELVFTVPANATGMRIQLPSMSAAYATYYDDVRVHPYNSNIKSFVYNDVNLRLMAELDENNYASMYEYDDDGTLIRVKKETEKGIMTISETRSSMIKEE
jgi:hypothetical protein